MIDERKIGDRERTLRYEDLTASEQVGMEEFVRLSSEGELHEAIRANMLALDLEHLISTLPLHPDDVDDEMRDEVRKLRDQLHGLTGRKVLLHVLGDR